MRKYVLVKSFAIVFLIFLSSNSMDSSYAKNAENSASLTIVKADSFTDFGGNVYKTVRIGNQVWMAENLKATRGANGSMLDGVYSYNNDESNVPEYGRLYTWEAAKNACPKGWHLPAKQEWDSLASSLGPDPVQKLSSGGRSGFDARFGGRLAGDSFGYMGEIGLYWSSTESMNPDHAVQVLLIKNEANIRSDHTPVSGGLSVRYVKD